MIVQCATFSKSLNPRNIDKSVSDAQRQEKLLTCEISYFTPCTRGVHGLDFGFFGSGLRLLQTGSGVRLSFL